MYSVYTTATNTDYDNIVVAPKNKILEFDILACSDVHIALSDTLTTAESFTDYEIVIGGWGNTRYSRPLTNINLAVETLLYVVRRLFLSQGRLSQFGP